jgi:hypothetical protein
MFLPWRRTLFVGDKVESMTGCWSEDVNRLEHGTVVYQRYEQRCVYPMLLTRQGGVTCDCEDQGSHGDLCRVPCSRALASDGRRLSSPSATQEVPHKQNSSQADLAA